MLRIATIILFMMTFILFACNNNSDMSQNNSLKKLSTNQDKHNSLSNTDIADHLAKISKDVPGVNEAISLVLGPYALVGIDVEDQLDSSRVGTIKYSVTEALRDDPYGKTAVVIADPDMTERVRVIREKINEGKPSKAIFDEIASIVARTIPITPTEEQPIEKDRNMEIDKNEEKDLDNIQRKQSTENNN